MAMSYGNKTKHLFFRQEEALPSRKKNKMSFQRYLSLLNTSLNYYLINLITGLHLCSHGYHHNDEHSHHSQEFPPDPSHPSPAHPLVPRSANTNLLFGPIA